MAATIEGAFVIVDRASGPMAKMERQARKTQAAIDSLGRSMDRNERRSSGGGGGGGASGAAKMERQATSLKKVASSASSAASGVESFGVELENTSRKSDGLLDKVGKLGKGFIGFGAVLGGLKLVLMGVAFTSLAQAIGVLLGGLVSLVPAVARATGALAAMPAVIGAAVQGIGTFALALGGVGEALKAGTALQKDAGKAASDHADQMRAAANAIRSAERGIVMSQRSTRDAQVSLTQARRDAVRQLTDQRLAAEQAALGEEGAALALKRAKQKLATSAIDPNTSFTDLQEAQLGVREAELSARRSRIDNRRASIDSTRQPGVNRRNVRSSQEALSDALYGQAEAARALADAQRQANKLQESGGTAADAYRDALKNLSPEAQSFVKKLVGLRDVMKDLRASAGRQLFPGLEKAVDSGLKLVPLLNRGLEKTGGVIGNNVAGAAASAATGRGRADAEALMNHQAAILDRMLHGARNIGGALVDLALAARPFTNWLTRTVEAWTKYVARTTEAARVSGRLADFLAGSRSALERFGRILSNLWGAMRGISDASSALGERLWDGAERATKGWDDYLHSVEGAAQAKQWFDSLYKPLHAMGQVTRDLVRAWARITVAPEFTTTIETLGRAVPSLESLMMSLSSLGPASAGFLEQIVRLMSNLPFEPVVLLLNALTKLLDIVNDIIERVPKLGLVLSAVIGASLLLRIGTLLGKMKLLRGMFAAIAYSAKTAGLAMSAGLAAGTLAAAGAGGRGAVGKLGGLAAGALGLTAAGRVAGKVGMRFGFGPAVKVAAGGGAVRGAEDVAARAGAPLVRLAGGGLALAGGTSRLAALGGGAARGGLLARVGASTAGRVAARASTGPLGIAAGIGTMIIGDKIGGRAGGAVSGAGLGAGIGAGVGGLFGGIGAGPGALIGAGLGAGLGALTGGVDEGKKALKEFGDTADASFQRLLAQRNVAGLRKLADEARGFAKDNKGARAELEKLAGVVDNAAVSIGASKLSEQLRGQLNGMTTMTHDGARRIARQFDRMPPELRKGARQSMVAFAAQLEASGQLPKGAASRLRAAIDRRLEHDDGKTKRAARKILKNFAEGLIAGIPGISAIGKTLLDATGLGDKIGDATSGFRKRNGGVGIRETLARNLEAAGGGDNIFSSLLRTGVSKTEQGRTQIKSVAQLKRFQHQNGLEADGVIGPATKAAMREKKTVNAIQRDQARDTNRNTRDASNAAKRNSESGSRAVQKNAEDTRKAVKGSNDSILGSFLGAFRGSKDAATNQTAQARANVSRNTAAMMTDARKSLRGMGYSAGDITRILSGKGAGGSAGSGGTVSSGTASDGSGGLRPHARGGRIKGSGLFDTVPVAPGSIAAPGELIVNRHTERRIQQNYGVNLGAEVAGESRPHYAPFATGGRVPGVTPALSSLIQRLDAKGFAHGSTTDGGHTATSYHYKGMAVDYGNASNNMAALWAALQPSKRRYAELFGPSSMSPKPTLMHYGAGFSDPSLQAGHEDHIHIALAGGQAGRLGRGGNSSTAGGGALDPIKIRGRRTGMAGFPGGVGDAVLRAQKAGIEGAVNDAIGATGGGGGGTSFGASTWNRELGRFAAARKWSAADWRWIVQHESGGNPSARNPSSGAIGLGQMLGSNVSKYNGNGTPVQQIDGMGRYIADRYGNPTKAKAFWQAHNWYAQGGRVPDYAGAYKNGGEFEVRRPTMFMAGDGGGGSVERVNVTTGGSRGKSGGGATTVSVSIGQVHMHRKGDLARAIREELDKVAEDLEAREV